MLTLNFEQSRVCLTTFCRGDDIDGMVSRWHKSLAHVVAGALMAGRCGVSRRTGRPLLLPWSPAGLARGGTAQRSVEFSVRTAVQVSMADGNVDGVGEACVRA